MSESTEWLEFLKPQTHEPQSQATNERDKRAIRRAVYAWLTAKDQKIDLRVRCVTVVRAELAMQWADDLVPDRGLPLQIKFHSWRDPIHSFAGSCADYIVCSGYGPTVVLANLWARLRDQSRVGKWGTSLEMVS